MMTRLLARLFVVTRSEPVRAADDAALSRRGFLLGLGAVGVAAAFGATAMGAAEAQAAAMDNVAIPQSVAPEVGSELEEVDVHRANYHRRRDRLSRREARYLCRNNRRFRRRNPGLCQSVVRRGRPGACVQIGPLLICD